MSRILLLEDDEALGRGICMALETPNCTVTHCSTRLQAIKILQGVVFDLLILDINLPDGSGLELLRTLRQNGTSTPAILLTANDLELDEVTGLEAGADDYITKPFSLAVLRARVNAQLRRSVPVKQERIELNGFILDFTRMEFSKEGTIIDLPRQNSACCACWWRTGAARYQENCCLKRCGTAASLWMKMPYLWRCGACAGSSGMPRSELCTGLVTLGR